MVEADVTPAPKKSFGRRLRRWLIGLLLLTIACVAAIRYLPTQTYVGRVQRVYEKALEYRVEFVTDEGEVRVFTNQEQRFPYLKFNTADLQANLEKYHRDGDVIRLKVWGVRSAMLSSFPNIVDSEHLQAGTARAEARSERITAAVLTELRTMQLVPPGREAEVQTRVKAAIDAASKPVPLLAEP